MKNHRYIYYLIGSSIILVIINTLFYLLQASQNEKNDEINRKISKTIETANTLISALKNAETGQRGYLLTKNEIYLKPYRLAEGQIYRTFNTLSLLTADNQGQQNNIRQLKRWINLKRSELSATIGLNKKGRSDLALKKVNTNIGKDAMEKIETLINTIINNEKLRLNNHNKFYAKLNSRIQIFTIAGSYILLVIIIAALITVIQNREQITRLFRQLDDKNKQLEKRKNELVSISNELIKQNGELERFAYIASHDLRAPGINLDSLLKLYESSVDLAEKEELMQAIKLVSANLLIKLDDLIEMLRHDNESALVQEDLHFEDIFEKTLKTIALDVRKSKARIEHDFSEAPNIRYLKSYLESIMQNLMTNAIKYRHPDRPPLVIMKTFSANGKTIMEVKDNGVGIDLEKYGDRLFGIYQTFHNQKDSKGIGLFITKAQILAMGGSITAKSTPGEGTTFTVAFS